LIRIYDSNGVLQEFEPVGFHEILGADHQPGGSADVWEDWDVSAEVPDGAKAVLVAMMHGDAGNSMIGTRKKGSTAERDRMIAPSAPYTQITELNANRVLQISAHDLSSATFWLLGYWK
jgi:hypothetical protein